MTRSCGRALIFCGLLVEVVDMVITDQPSLEICRYIARHTHSGNGPIFRFADMLDIHNIGNGLNDIPYLTNIFGHTVSGTLQIFHHYFLILHLGCHQAL